MKNPTPIYHQILTFLSQYSLFNDLRHIKTLSAMVAALLGSQKLTLSEWEPYIDGKALQAQSYERRWQRFFSNPKVNVEQLYVPLALAALSKHKNRRLYLAIDTTVLWDKYCMIHLAVVCCGRAIPLLWKVIEHDSATVSFAEYKPMLRMAQKILSDYPDIMFLGDRAFACHELMEWLETSPWHYALRLKMDVALHGVKHLPVQVSELVPEKNQAVFLRNVGLWSDGLHRTNLVIAHAAGAQETWAVITDEEPSLNTLWQYGKRFCIEELFLDIKSGVFQLEDSHIRSSKRLKRLYLVAALAILYGTTQGMTVQVAGLRKQVDPHKNRGISYLKIGLRYLQGVLNKGRQLLFPIPLFGRDPEPCFASKKDKEEYDYAFEFSLIKIITCYAPS
jgi:Transposase DDE domain